MSFPTKADAKVPHLDVNADTGIFVYAVSKLSPGKSYMAEGTTCSWTEFMRIWSEVTGQKTKYQEVTIEQFALASPDREFGWEAGDMFAYSSDPGYDGGDETLWKSEDIRKVSSPDFQIYGGMLISREAGVECPMTSLEEYMRKQDWTSVLQQ